MVLNFEKFIGTRMKFKNPAISISKRSGFTFNGGFYREIGLENYKGVSLSYDKSEKAIGFSFSHDIGDHSIFKLTHKGKMAAIVASSFFKAYKIDAKKYAGWYGINTHEDPQQGKIFYIKLDEGKQK